MVNRDNTRVKARFKKKTNQEEAGREQKLKKESRREALLQRADSDPLSLI